MKAPHHNQDTPPDRASLTLAAGNEVVLLTNGEHYFPALVEALRGARESIYLDFYRISDDRAGNFVGAILGERARAGVDVRVIYDHIGSFASEELFRSLEAGGVRTAAFNPVSLLRSVVGINRRDHRKMAIVDGAVGFVGGLNIGDEYGDPGKGWSGWRDTAVRVAGPAVAQMTHLFARSWKKLGGDGPPVKPAAESAGPPGGMEGGMDAAVLGTETLRHRRRVVRTYRQALTGARRSIYIQNAYFIPPFSVRRTLRAAVRRGVEVKIIVPLHGDLPMNEFASRHLFARFLRDGAQIYRYPGPVMHMKAAVIDGAWSTVGSFNLNHRSFFHDIETTLLVLDERFGAEMERVFVEDLSRCVPVDPRTWDRRPAGEKILERFCYTFKYWL